MHCAALDCVALQTGLGWNYFGFCSFYFFFFYLKISFIDYDTHEPWIAPSYLGLYIQIYLRGRALDLPFFSLLAILGLLYVSTLSA